MAFVLNVRRQGTSLHICIKQEICKRLGLKHGDVVIAELTEVEKDALGKTLTAHYGDEIIPNSLIIKKDGIKLQF